MRGKQEFAFWICITRRELHREQSTIRTLMRDRRSRWRKGIPSLSLSLSPSLSLSLSLSLSVASFFPEWKFTYFSAQSYQPLPTLVSVIISLTANQIPPSDAAVSSQNAPSQCRSRHHSTGGVCVCVCVCVC